MLKDETLENSRLSTVQKRIGVLSIITIYGAWMIAKQWIMWSHLCFAGVSNVHHVTLVFMELEKFICISISFLQYIYIMVWRLLWYVVFETNSTECRIFHVPEAYTRELWVPWNTLKTSKINTFWVEIQNMPRPINMCVYCHMLRKNRVGRT